MANLSGLKTQIQATEDIATITSAMEQVASAKLRQIGKRLGGGQAFIKEVYAAFNQIIQDSTSSQFLKTDDRPAKKTLWLVINSNLGLCGGYNNNLNKLVLTALKADDSVYAFGQKAVNFYRHQKINLFQEFTKIDVNFSSDQASEIGKELLEAFVSQKYDEIMIAYTHFVNNATFEPTLLRLFPIIKNAPVAQNHQVVEFYPDPNTVLEKTISLYLNTVVYGSILESQISEQASRRAAMESATKNGHELLDKLNLEYNRERQATITQELIEIINGAKAQK